MELAFGGTRAAVNDTSSGGERTSTGLGHDPLLLQLQDGAEDPAHHRSSWLGEMPGGSEHDGGGEDCYQVEKHLQAPANILIMSLGIRVCGIVFFLRIDMIFSAQGADT